MTLTALVTGGESGIGAATVERLSDEGINCITLDVSPSADLVVDVSNLNEVNDLIHDIGPIDILINNAGIAGALQPLCDTTTEDWERVFAVNVTGTFNLCRAVVPGMVDRNWGRVVNVAGMAGKEGNPLCAAYSASKAAVIGLTKSLSKEIAGTGVLVNAIAPGIIVTPASEGTDPEYIADLAAKIPLGRRGTPQEAAELIAWLSSDKMTFSTGFTFDLSGGRATY